MIACLFTEFGQLIIMPRLCSCWSIHHFFPIQCSVNKYIISVFKDKFLLFFPGTQLTLCNPICLIGYIWASWRFFNERVYDEEITLIDFFGEEYLAYQKKVTSVGVPFVKGFEYNVEMVKNS